MEFARGPGLKWSSLVMIGGICWRLFGILLLRRRRQRAAARHGLVRQLAGGGALIATRFIPRRTFWPRITVSVVLSTAFHVGLAIILLGGAPHVPLIHQVTGLTWPNLPKGVVVVVSGLTLASMIALLARRIHHPVLRLLSTVDDYLSRAAVFLPFATSVLLSGDTIAGYGSLLKVHILSVELMMVWFPFGKLMHGMLVFAGRSAMGINFTRKGAAT